MQFEYTGPQTELEVRIGGYFHINMLGNIEAGDDEKFRAFLEKNDPPPRTLIYINSLGGNVEAAIGIGRIIRECWYSTSVGTYILGASSPEDYIVPRELQAGHCMSSATLILLGGKHRYYPSGCQFGVHQFSYRNPTPDDLDKSQRLSAKIAKYIQEMGIPADFMEVSADTPRDKISLLSEERLRALKVITGGDTGVEWTVNLVAGLIYVIPNFIDADSRDSQKRTNLNRWRKLEVCDGFGDFVAAGL